MVAAFIEKTSEKNRNTNLQPIELSSSALALIGIKLFGWLGLLSLQPPLLPLLSISSL